MATSTATNTAFSLQSYHFAGHNERVHVFRLCKDDMEAQTY